MKTNVVLIFLIVLVAGAFYLLGKKNGASSQKTTMVENVNLVKLIAELGALDVTGKLDMKVSNKGEESGNWDRFKNYLAENTLQVSVPFEAKFGVDMSHQKMNINTKDSLAVISLPHARLLSLQLKMDRLETMTQTGIFTKTSMDDLVKAQKRMYVQAMEKIEKDPAYIKLAEDHIVTILDNYYKPLGYKVKCEFTNAGAEKPVQSLQ